MKPNGVRPSLTQGCSASKQEQLLIVCEVGSGHVVRTVKWPVHTLYRSSSEYFSLELSIHINCITFS
jgi:hypothetical protein